MFQGDANRSESDDEKKSDNFEEDEKVEQLRDTGKGKINVGWLDLVCAVCPV